MKLNVVQRVTWQTLKLNRRRTVVTILGTAVAVAMVTAIAVLAASFADMSLRYSVSAMGDWHVAYGGMDNAAREELLARNDVVYVDARQARGYSPVAQLEGRSKTDIWFTAYDEAAFERLPVTLTEGRLPEAPGEYVLSTEILRHLDIEVGDTLTLPWGHYDRSWDPGWGEEPDDFETNSYYTSLWRLDNYTFVEEETRSFTVVGFAELGWLDENASSYTALGVVEPAAADVLDLYIGVTKPTTEIYDEFGALFDGLYERYAAPDAVDSGVTLQFNWMLLASNGVSSHLEVLQSLSGFIIILLLIVVLGSVSLISNAFSISLSERVRALGMLAGVGATKRQKRASVFFEAFVIGIAAIPLGVVAGIVGIAITIFFVGEGIGQAFDVNMAMVMVVPWWALLFTVLFSAGILLLSAWIPARKASRVAAITAMRGSDAKVKIHRSRSTPIIRRVLGYEAELGIKNSKRSRARYYAILSSLVVSVVMFLTISSSMGYVRESAGLMSQTNGASLQGSYSAAQGDGDRTPDMEALLARIRETPGAEEVALLANYSFWWYLDEAEVPARVLDHPTMQDRAEGGDLGMWVQMFALDDSSYEAFLEENAIEAQAMDGALPIVVCDTIQVRSDSGGYEKLRSTDLAAGDIFEVDSVFYTEDGARTIDLAVLGVADSLPPLTGTGEYWSAAYVPIVVRLSDFEALAALYFDPDTTRNWTAYIRTNTSAALQEELEDMALQPEMSRWFNDMEANRQRNLQIVAVAEVFTYGFVVLITLVCAANIFNTISTGIALRAREFAMLRSAGMTPKGFDRMMDCETAFYGIKALLYGIPLSIILTYFLFRTLRISFSFGGFGLPWGSWLIAAVGVLLLVGLSMLYGRSKVRGMNIAETLKNENW